MFCLITIVSTKKINLFLLVENNFTTHSLLLSWPLSHIKIQSEFLFFSFSEVTSQRESVRMRVGSERAMFVLLAHDSITMTP